MANIPEFNRTTYAGEDGEFGLSIASWGAGILYNKDLLARRSAPTTVPTTWDEFLALLTEAEGRRHHPATSSRCRACPPSSRRSSAP